MRLFGSTIRDSKQLLVIYYLLTLHLGVIYLVSDKIAARYDVVPAENTGGERSPVSSTNEGSTPAEPNRPAMPGPVPPGRRTTIDQSALSLIVPVEGVSADQLTDSFNDSRSEDRAHDAIDIPAPAGTRVLAAADGEILRFWDSAAGGKTIYQASLDKKYIFYYAHLADRASDVRIGEIAKQGQTIGFVGDTGNAGPGNYHLHFSVSVVTDPKRYWEGVPVNPYPLLKRN